MAWSMDITGPNGGSVIATDVPFKSGRITWTLDGPGAAEIEILDSQISDNWTPGLHRVRIKKDGSAQFDGYANRLHRTGRPGAVTHSAAAVGSAWILDRRIVRGQYEITGTTAEIVESLLANAEGQLNGDMGFTMGTVAPFNGAYPTKTRSYCFGVVIGDAIRELANIKRGFDWFINPSGELELWRPSLGVDSGQTLSDANVSDFEVTFETAEMTTTVSALGEPADPFGPRHDMVRSGFADSYGRREVVIDVPSNDQDELIDAATQELQATGGGQLEVRASWVEGYGPWSLFDVWCGDRVDAVLPNYHGGDQEMRCTEITVTLEPTPQEIFFIEQKFQSLVEDITEGDPDDEESS